MRMRKKPNMEARIERCSEYFLKDPGEHRGRWGEFTGGRELCVEIGCGKGQFLITHAKEEPLRFFIGIERSIDALIMAMEKAAAEGIQNIAFINMDAEELESIFAPGEMIGLFLNFSDPWPKKRQIKRRLTHPRFLEKYDVLLPQDGWICQKTDNERLFEYSLNTFSDMGFRLSDITFDLHATGEPNIMTEYEARFSELGQRIFRLVARKYYSS